MKKNLKTLYDLLFKWEKFSYDSCDEEERIIGKGAFGKVMKGKYQFDDEIPIPVALKRVHFRIAKMNQILSEIATSVIPRHPCIVPIIGWNYVTETGERDISFLMPYIKGKDLNKCLNCDDEEDELTYTDRMCIAYGIARALMEAHKHNVTHRDLKPQNIKIQKDDSLLIPKILDFGLATLKNKFNDFKGTNGYISPELCDGFDATTKCDVYAFGVILLQLALDLPILTMRFFEKRLNNRYYPKIDVINECLHEGNYSENFISLIMSCLESDPSKRIDMRTVVAEMEEKVYTYDGDFYYKYQLGDIDTDTFTKYILEITRMENNESSNYSLSKSLTYANVASSAFDNKSLLQIHDDVKLNKTDAMLTMAAMWFNGSPSVGRKDIYQALILAISAWEFGNPNAQSVIVEFSKHIDGFEITEMDHKSMYNNILDCITKHAEQNDWVAQTRLGIILYKSNNPKLKAKSKMLLEIGKQHNCKDAIYCLSQLQI